MYIGGFQKLTLLDYPGHTACIVFTRGCNFRCSFCHNSGLVLPGQAQPAETEQEILRYLAKRQGLLDGVVISGGEPLLWPQLTGFIERIRALGFLIKLDTNGSFPERLEALLSAGLLDYVAMDIKQTPEKYGTAIGFSGNAAPASGKGASAADLVEQSLAILRGFQVPFELRTTVVRGIHTPEDLVSIAAWIRGTQDYYLQPYVDSGNVLAPQGLSSFSTGELEALLPRIRAFCPNTKIRG